MPPSTDPLRLRAHPRSVVPVHTYEYDLKGRVGRVEADTWRRDLDTAEVVFVERHRDDVRGLSEQEVVRLALELPHRHIRRI